MEREKRKLEEFRAQIQKRIHVFIKDASQRKMKFECMDKTHRTIVHEVADIASLTSFSFGQEEVDRYVMVWKKEFAPCDEELLAYRREEEWDPEKAKQLAARRALEQLEADSAKSHKLKAEPSSNYREKYKHLIGDTAAKDAAQSTKTTRSYGFVSSENKRDQRTIEQVLADTRAKKKQKTEHSTSSENKTATGEHTLQCLPDDPGVGKSDVPSSAL